jgi:DNA-binding FrmR family transcriptional regulator
MAHAWRDRKKLVQRIRRIRGQMDALERGLEEGTECGSILQQVAAVRGAVNGLMAELLEGHLREHVVHSDQETRSEALDEVIQVLRTYLK